MQINQFIDNFRNQFIDADDITVTPDTDFRQLPTWDSLTGMSVLVMVQDEYGVEMKDIDIKSCKTVGDIYEFIKSKKDA